MSARIESEASLQQGIDDLMNEIEFALKDRPRKLRLMRFFYAWLRRFFVGELVRADRRRS